MFCGFVQLYLQARNKSKVGQELVMGKLNDLEGSGRGKSAGVQQLGLLVTVVKY